MGVTRRAPGAVGLPRRRRLGARLRILLVALVVAMLLVAAPAAVADSGPGYILTRLRVPAKAEPQPTTPVELYTELFRTTAPGTAPLVLLAHGFGGSYRDMVPMAERLAAAGYDVAVWSARGFGTSTGEVHLDDPDYEVADVSTVLDAAVRGMDNVEQTGGDPVVAVAGVSYGGAVALMAAAQDRRIDAVVPIDTWNDLASAFFPDSVVAAPSRTPVPILRDKANPYGPPWVGPLKQQWASQFLTSPTGTDRRYLCSRMARALCDMFEDASTTGRPSQLLLDTLRRHSPAPTLDKVEVPVLLVQGVDDSLFGLDQADATARALAAHHDQVWMRWTSLGHGSSSPAGSDTDLVDPVLDWLNHQLRPQQTSTPAPPRFVYPVPDDSGHDRLYSLAAYPGLGGSDALPTTTIAWKPGQESAVTSILSPPGGLPASTLGLPGGLGDGAPSVPVSTYQLAALPGQSIAFDTVRLDRRVVVVGSPQVHLGLGSSTTDATVYVSLWQVNGDTATMPRQLVAPVRVAIRNVGSGGTLLTVALPPSTYVLPAGSVWRVLITSTDSTFANPRDFRGYSPATVQLGYDLTVPTVTDARPVAAASEQPQWRDHETVGVVIAIAAALVLGAGWLVFQRRRVTAVPGAAGSTRDDQGAPDVPLLVQGLTKSYRDGHKAVDGVDLRAGRGQIVGLLGPNGAGKTTVMRMLMGLIRPDAGAISVLGEPVTPGAAVLRHVGALVEGPGFLPHLTGRQNLEAYWAATGRPPQEAHLTEVLDVAALGAALDRPVRSYSQGMRQRLGIAQAMLGLPDLLILDEPTNGLDPPQIAAMRPVLHAYAEAGRTVLVSSHLLAEVELTCSHVVVMQEGKVVVAGAVSDLLSDTGVTRIELDRVTSRAGDLQAGDVETAAERLRGVPGVTAVSVVDLHTMDVRAELPRGEVVAAAVSAGLQVASVSAQRHLEEVFMTVIGTDDPRTVRDR